jgi:hypothetical protein
LQRLEKLHEVDDGFISLQWFDEQKQQQQDHIKDMSMRSGTLSAIYSALSISLRPIADTCMIFITTNLLWLESGKRQPMPHRECY